MATRPQPPQGPHRSATCGWSGASRSAIPGHIAIAALALLVAAGGDVGRSLRLQADHRQRLRARRRQHARHRALVRISAAARRRAWRSPPPSASISSRWLGERTVADIRLAVHRNLLRLSPGFFEENRPAEITSRITVDTTIIEQVVGTTVSVALRNIVMGIACIVILFALAPKLAALMLLGIPLVVVPIVFLGRRVRAISTQQPGPHRRRRHGHQRSARRDEDRPGLQPAGPRGQRASPTPSSASSRPPSGASCCARS